MRNDCTCDASCFFARRVVPTFDGVSDCEYSLHCPCAWSCIHCARKCICFQLSDDDSATISVHRGGPLYAALTARFAFLNLGHPSGSAKNSRLTSSLRCHL